MVDGSNPDGNAIEDNFWQNYAFKNQTAVKKQQRKNDKKTTSSVIKPQKTIRNSVVISTPKEDMATMTTTERNLNRSPSAKADDWTILNFLRSIIKQQ